MSMPNSVKGMIVGLGGTAATAIGSAFLVWHHSPLRAFVDDPEEGVANFSPGLSDLSISIEAAVLVMLFGAIPGGGFGALMGALMTFMDEVPAWLRAGIVALIASVGILVVGVMSGFLPIALPAIASAIAASVVLEVWTRDQTTKWNSAWRTPDATRVGMMSDESMNGSPSL